MSEAEKALSAIPRHVAIIMDGNGRWAKKRGWPRSRGHRAGIESVRRVLRYCRDAHIEYLTLYAFSKENWKRPHSEIAYLMRLLTRFLREQERELHDNKIRLRVMGCREDLAVGIINEIERVEQATADYSEGHLIVALSYGSRDEITAAARSIAIKAARGELEPEKLDERTFAEHLYLPDVPDPDLVIRTSGELRLSNFLLWQVAYSEIYITSVCWPDFDEDEFKKALASYAGRSRRFGDIMVTAKGE